MSTADAAVNLATVEDLELYSDEQIDAPELLLSAASAIVRGYCGWGITQEVATFRLTGSGTQSMHLPTMRLAGVSTVKVAGTALAGWDWTYDGVLTSYRPFPFGRRIDVACTHGYEIIPADIVAVTCATALKLHLNPAGATSETIAGYSTSYGQLLAQHEKWILDRYRMPGLT